MPSEVSEHPVVVVVVGGTVLTLLLITFIVRFFFLYQRRQLQHFQEKQAMKAAFEQEILQSQLEVQNATLQYVGKELHDNLGQLLSVVRFSLNSLEESPAANPVHQQIAETNGVVAQAINDLRALSKSLDGDFVQDFGLVESLAHELQRIKRTRRFETDLRVEGTPYSLDYQKEIVLFRMAQELLNNAMKHSDAEQLRVVLRYEAQQFVLMVRDNGVGFDPAVLSAQDLSQSGAGLRNVRRRAELIGGTCHWQTAPGQGTMVSISIPLNAL
jgi:two-component system, NarL family, sensor kinase